MPCGPPWGDRSRGSRRTAELKDATREMLSLSHTASNANMMRGRAY